MSRPGAGHSLLGLGRAETGIVGGDGSRRGEPLVRLETSLRQRAARAARC